MTDKAKKSTKKGDKDTQELARAIGALNATQHNPIAWGAVIAFVAPIIGRIAARIAARFVAQKLGKRLGKKIPGETADAVADRITSIVGSIKLPKS